MDGIVGLAEIVGSFLAGRKRRRKEDQEQAREDRRLALEEKRVQAGIDSLNEERKIRDADRAKDRALKERELDLRYPQPSGIERIINGVRSMMGAAPIPTTGGIIDPVKAAKIDDIKAGAELKRTRASLLGPESQARIEKAKKVGASRANRSSGGGGVRGSSVVKDVVDLVGKAGAFAGKVAKGLSGGSKPADPEVERGRKQANDERQDRIDNRAFLDNDAPRIVRSLKEKTAGGFLGFGKKDPGPMLDQIERKLEATDPKRAALLRRNRAAILAEIGQ